MLAQQRDKADGEDIPAKLSELAIAFAQNNVEYIFEYFKLEMPLLVSLFVVMVLALYRPR